jgi:hypothetical protein
MVMASLPNLHKENLSTKVIDDLLKAFDSPPFDRYVIFATRGDDPEWSVLSSEFVNLRIPGLLLDRQMNVTSARRKFDLQSELLVEKVNEPMKAVSR